MTAFAIPEKLRLDNAANIYPASMSKHYSSLYRMSVTLTEAVDEKILQEALVTVSERIPTFHCTLRAGAFWWFLDRIQNDPEVQPLRPLKLFEFRNQGGFLYRVAADGNRIHLDVFHALTDGFGAATFLLTLTGEYLRRRNGIEIPYNGLVLDPSEKPIHPEVEDSFKSVFTGRKGRLEKNVDAFHIKGERISRCGVEDVRVVMPMDRIKAACEKYECTVTDLMASVMLSALQEEHKTSPKPSKRTVLKVSVPINLRPLYGSRTLRNFSSYVNIGVDVCNGYLSFRNIVRTVKAQKAHDLLQENLEPKIAANVQLEENMLVRCIPLVIKHPIIDIINLMHGDRFCTQTLSNLGKVNLPGPMTEYVTDLDFILGKQRGNSGACSCVGYGDKMYFHLTRKITRDNFERAFVRQLSHLGIPSEVTTDTLA